VRAARALAALAAATLAACSLQPVDVEPHQALLTQVPSDIATAATLPSTLLVDETVAEAPYDTARMAYGTRPLELAYFARTEWADKPASMLNALLVRTLERTRRFRAVAAPPQADGAGYVLDSRLTELRQDFSSDPATVTLAVRVELRDRTSRHAVATQEFEAREPLAARSAYAGAVAANAAAARVLDAIARFVVEHTG
jgi:ABC-type uncharacterized transport system auxiliary subunit